MLLAISITVAVTVFITIVFLNLRAGEKQIHYELIHRFAVSDPQFVRTMDHLLGPGILPGILGGSPRFENAGTFRKSISTGTTTIGGGVPFNNFGTVDLRRGILAVNDSYNSSSNALLNCALGGTTAGTGFGQLQVAGSIALIGALSVDFISGFVPATNDSFTLLTAGTRTGTFTNFHYPSNAVTMQMSNTPNSVVARVTSLVANVVNPVLYPPVLSSSNVLLSWTAESNRTYRLEFKSDLSLTNWNSVPGDVTAFSNSAAKLDGLTSSNRFYRVRSLP